MAESDANTANDAAPGPEAGATSGPEAGAATITATHGAPLRRALIQRLPRLEHAAGSMLADLALDRDRDLRGAIELDVDAFLVPLTATRPRDRR